MDPIQRFQEYADAFEIFYEKDDPSILEPFFTEDAVYETLGVEALAGRHEGRPAVMDFFKQILDAFDRRFAKRELEVLEGPELRDGNVWFRWRATYRAGDAPPLHMEGEETVEFDGDRIRRLEDRFDAAGGDATAAWMAEHAAELGGS
jgi:hypothetical protein